MFWWSREFCYADWAETCRNLFGQELCNNSSSFCSSGTQNFHLPMYLYDYLFLTMRWNYKWGLGWKALSYSLVHRFLFELKRTAFAYAFSLMLGFTTYRTRFSFLLFTSFHITRHRHQVLLGQVFILLGRLFRSVFLGKKLGDLRFCPISGPLCVCTPL